MIRTIKRGFLLLLLVAVAYAGFRWGPAVFPQLERMVFVQADDGAPSPGPSPELADATLDRFEAFRQGTLGDRLTFSSDELTSVIRYSLPGILPAGVDNAEVELSDGRANVLARVAVREFPELPDVDAVVGLLPDTVLIELRGELEPYDQAHLMLVVDRVRAARIPLPARMVGEVLAGLAGERRPGLQENALAVPLPDGLASVSVEGDSLVMIAKRGG